MFHRKENDKTIYRTENTAMTIQLLYKKKWVKVVSSYVTQSGRQKHNSNLHNNAISIIGRLALGIGNFNKHFEI